MCAKKTSNRLGYPSSIFSFIHQLHSTSPLTILSDTVIICDSCDFVTHTKAELASYGRARTSGLASIPFHSARPTNLSVCRSVRREMWVRKLMSIFAIWRSIHGSIYPRDWNIDMRIRYWCPRQLLISVMAAVIVIPALHWLIFRLSLLLVSRHRRGIELSAAVAHDILNNLKLLWTQVSLRLRMWHLFKTIWQITTSKLYKHKTYVKFNPL